MEFEIVEPKLCQCHIMELSTTVPRMSSMFEHMVQLIGSAQGNTGAKCQCHITQMHASK